MKKKFKINLLALGVLVLSLVLAACNSAASPTAKPSNTATSAPATQPAVEPTTAAPIVAATTAPAVSTTVPAVVDANLKGDLLIWEASASSQQQFMREQVTAFGKAFPGIKVTMLRYNSEEMLYAMEDAVKSGKLPDLILASSDFVTDFNNLKAIQPADKVVDKAFLDKFNANAQASTNVSGTQYGVAYTYGGTPVMLYNKKLVPTAPETWSELAKVVTPLYDQNTRSIGLAIEVNEPYFLSSVLGAYGGSMLNSSNQPTLDTKEMVNALTFIDQLGKNRVVRAQSRANDNQIDYAFRDGRLGIFITGDWDIAKYSQFINPTGEAKVELAVAPLPKIDGTNKSPVPYFTNKAFFFGAKVSGDKVKLVNTYLNWLTSTEQQAALMTKTGNLPATKAFLEGEAVKGSTVWGGLLAQLEIAKPMPTTREMQAVWAAIRPNLQDVVAGTLKPTDAAKKMQQTAAEGVLKLSSP
jgi:maltose-binding protein MalE